MNEDFSIYQLRLGYLNHIHDGVGERLITLNSTVLNNPALRTAGWLPDATATKRCYSPPIPTSAQEVRNNYFKVPRRPTHQAGDEEGDGVEGGMVTGHHGSDETLEPAAVLVSERREKRERTRRKQQLEEDDSSDLSDESEEEEKGPAQGIKFNKMPVRNRTPPSPPSRVSTIKARPPDEESASNITSPTRPKDSTISRIRSGSAGAVEAVKQRARRDTTTSSDMSSDNEMAPDVFRRKLPDRPGKGPSVLALEADIQEEAQEPEEPDDAVNSDLDDEDEDSGVDEASDLSDGFDDTVNSPSILGMPNAGVGAGISTSSPTKQLRSAIAPGTPSNASPKRPPRDVLPKLPALPSNPQLTSNTAPTSLIANMLKGSDSGPSNEKPFRKFAALSGDGESNPLWVKIYAPFSEQPSTPIEVALRRTRDEKPVTVAELIGLALCRYEDEGYQPELTGEASNVNQWTLRIIEDEEIDYDFPALARTRPVVDFTSNNNRPPQRRMRDKPWDEFGLVRATEEQVKEHDKSTPQMQDLSTPASPGKTSTKPPSQPAPNASAPAHPRPHLTFASAVNPILGPSFTPAAFRKHSTNPLDQPQREARQGALKTGAPRTVVVYYTDAQSFNTRHEEIETTTDSYIAEIFDQSCKRFNLDKALYVLKVHGKQTVAPVDRTVEALGDNLRLDLARRRFMGVGVGAGDAMFGLGLSGSPGSTSPNAPLDLAPSSGTPKKKKGFTLHSTPHIQKSEFNATTASLLNLTAAGGLGVDGKRYNVLRKQPLSFASPHPRTLIITPEYMTIMPAAQDSLAVPTGKVTNVPMTSIIGAKISRKHRKTVRILVFREKETKRYDFEAADHREAEEIVADVRKGMEAFGTGFNG